MRKFLLFVVVISLLQCDGKPFEDKEGTAASAESWRTFEFVFRTKPDPIARNVTSYSHVGPMDQAYYLKFDFDKISDVNAFLKNTQFAEQSESRNESASINVKWWPDNLKRFPMWARTNGDSAPWGYTYVWVDPEDRVAYSLTQ